MAIPRRVVNGARGRSMTLQIVAESCRSRQDTMSVVGRILPFRAGGVDVRSWPPTAGRLHACAGLLHRRQRPAMVYERRCTDYCNQPPESPGCRLAALPTPTHGRMPRRSNPFVSPASYRRDGMRNGLTAPRPEESSRIADDSPGRYSRQADVHGHPL